GAIRARLWKGKISYDEHRIIAKIVGWPPAAAGSPAIPVKGQEASCPGANREPGGPFRAEVNVLDDQSSPGGDQCQMLCPDAFPVETGPTTAPRMSIETPEKHHAGKQRVAGLKWKMPTLMEWANSHPCSTRGLCWENHFRRNRNRQKLRD